MNQTADPKTFVCPSDSEGGDPFAPASLRAVEQDRSGLCDIQNRSQFSYAFQYQGPALQATGTDKRSGWNTSGKDDPKMVILADMSPAFRAMNAEAIATTDDHTFELASSTVSATFPAGNLYVSVLGGLQNIVWNQTTAKASYVLGNAEDPRALNSPNHRSDGQNVVRLDGSGDFAFDPWAGAYMDNIWTIQDSAAYTASPQDSTAMLKARMQGLYDTATYTETALMRQWVVREESKNRYPDTFLVP
jgi:hypothetical protein